jgi:hypothetical protein
MVLFKYYFHIITLKKGKVMNKFCRDIGHVWLLVCLPFRVAELGQRLCRLFNNIFYNANPFTMYCVFGSTSL